MKCKVCNSDITEDATQCDMCMTDLTGKKSSLAGQQNVGKGCALMFLAAVVFLAGFVLAVDAYFKSGMNTANAVVGISGILSLGLFVYGLITTLPRK